MTPPCSAKTNLRSVWISLNLFPLTSSCFSSSAESTLLWDCYYTHLIHPFFYKREKPSWATKQHFGQLLAFILACYRFAFSVNTGKNEGTVSQIKSNPRRFYINCPLFHFLDRGNSCTTNRFYRSTIVRERVEYIKWPQSGTLSLNSNYQLNCSFKTMVVCLKSFRHLNIAAFANNPPT